LVIVEENRRKIRKNPTPTLPNDQDLEMDVMEMMEEEKWSEMAEKWRVLMKKCNWGRRVSEKEKKGK